MGISIFEKSTSVIRNVASQTRQGIGEMRIPLNRDHLTSEHVLNIKVSQGFGTAPLSSGDVINMIDSVTFETDAGQLINASGLSLLAISSFTEKQPAQRITLAAISTAQVFIDLHHENDGAFHDLFTALETGTLSQCDLVIRFKDPVASGVFVGGLVPAVPDFSVRVNAVTYPELTSKGESDIVESIDEETGEVVYDTNDLEGIGTFTHRVNEQRVTGTTKGEQQPIRLQSAGAQVRFLQFLMLDNATGMPVDHVIDNVRLTVEGKEIRVLSMDEIQAANEAKRGLVRVNSGLGVLDFGDREQAFLDLSDVNEALIHYSIAPTAPAAWEVRICEDYTEAR